ncbi:MAG: cyclic nucleotide-binding domain-containing protein [Melioribacteraceae bacterium]|nr:cyclic nucleotide-binding domain-containing protein [Melioribacteraceae bacterium]MCF8356393.1 cyclic nucleotide-binding domain-containing protein [Melioribacteraceae bacterium]MCF8392254.1 cyclic nucleotide-binding domain-containing protein [Melioribacteraceae bacterium]MCF8417586.1 cyclic nucleotide-binding domain-containing protein [Melioribacteraceae bacterium]
MNEEQSTTVDTIWSNVFSHFTKESEETKFDVLKRIPILKDLSKRELKEILKITYERNFESGEYIFQTGQPGASMFIIEQGEVVIVKKNEKDENVELARLKSNDFLGELALLDNSPRSASAYVEKPTKTLAIFRDDLLKLLENNPDLGRKVMHRLAITIGYRLKATNDLLLKKEKEINKSNNA